MFFNQLYNKIGKQPHRNARTSEVIAVFNTEDLRNMLSVSDGATISIPLDIKFGDGQQKMWFIKKYGEKKKRG